MNERQYPVNVLAITKEGERFLFLYDDESIRKLFEVLDLYAADPELNFSWRDAYELTRTVRDRMSAE